MTLVKGKWPWRVGTKVGRTIYDAAGNLIGTMDRKEDALLAAAAPELLEACRRLLSHQGKTTAQLSIAQTVADKEFAFAAVDRATRAVEP